MASEAGMAVVPDTFRATGGERYRALGAADGNRQLARRLAERDGA
jgi:hypothetical protein